MEEKKKMEQTPDLTAETGDSIDAVKDAEISTPQQGGENTPPDAGEKRDKEAEFEKLISGEYREEFNRRVKKIIDRRIKEVRTTKEKTEKMEKIIGKIAEKLGISDEEEKNDEGVRGTEYSAKNANKNPEREEMMRRLAAENAYLRKKRESDIREMQARNRIQAWERQAEETKAVYPEFDLKKELQSDTFRALIKAGVHVKQAYEVANLDEIIAVKSKDAEKKVVDNIRAKGKRPVENGSEPTGGILISSDAARLTKEQRAELAKRAARGERIEL